MEWTIGDSKCWICGNQNNLTDHHTLPKHWKPIHNVVVKICQKCHDRLNAEDLAGMAQFAFKVEQELGRQLGLWARIRTSISNHLTAQSAIVDAFKKKEDQK